MISVRASDAGPADSYLRASANGSRLVVVGFGVGCGEAVGRSVRGGGIGVDARSSVGAEHDAARSSADAAAMRLRLTVVRIRDLTADDAAACEAVVTTLPTFFGDPDGLRDLGYALRSQHGWVAETEDGVVAFLTVYPSSDDVMEITWMAVRNDYRRRGIGRELVERAAESTPSCALCVLTLGPSVPDEGYEGTRAFYRALGFIPIKELGLRSWNNSHALLLVRPLATS